MQMLTLKYNNIWALADGPHEEPHPSSVRVGALLRAPVVLFHQSHGDKFLG